MFIQIGGLIRSKTRVTQENIDKVESDALAFVNKTISSLEVAIAKWENSKPKNLKHKEQAIAFIEAHQDLSDWARDFLLKQTDEDFEVRIARLQNLADICDMYM